MKNRQGAIATLLTIGALVVIGVTAITSSFLINQKNTTNSKAEGAVANGDWDAASAACKAMGQNNTVCICSQFNTSGCNGSAVASKQTQSDGKVCTANKWDTTWGCWLPESSSPVVPPASTGGGEQPSSGVACASGWICGPECALKEVVTLFTNTYCPNKSCDPRIIWQAEALNDYITNKKLCIPGDTCEVCHNRIGKFTVGDISGPVVPGPVETEPGDPNPPEPGITKSVTIAPSTGCKDYSSAQMCNALCSVNQNNDKSLIYSCVDKKCCPQKIGCTWTPAVYKNPDYMPGFCSGTCASGSTCQLIKDKCACTEQPVPEAASCDNMPQPLERECTKKYPATAECETGTSGYVMRISCPDGKNDSPWCCKDPAPTCNYNECGGKCCTNETDVCVRDVLLGSKCATPTPAQAQPVARQDYISQLKCSDVGNGAIKTDVRKCSSSAPLSEEGAKNTVWQVAIGEAYICSENEINYICNYSSFIETAIASKLPQCSATNNCDNIDNSSYIPRAEAAYAINNCKNANKTILCGSNNLIYCCPPSIPTRITITFKSECNTSIFLKSFAPAWSGVRYDINKTLANGETLDNPLDISNTCNSWGTLKTNNIPYISAHIDCTKDGKPKDYLYVLDKFWCGEQ